MMKMIVEVNDEQVNLLVSQSLKESVEAMNEYLEKYNMPDHGWIAIFSTNKEEDIAMITKVRDALLLVLTEWYGIPDYSDKE
jgi:hypothetical protein